jgi:hypothetical protein
MAAHLIGLKRKAFVLWRPLNAVPTPKLIVGQFQAGNPNVLKNRQEFDLKQLPDHGDLWAIDAAECRLTDCQVSERETRSIVENRASNFAPRYVGIPGQEREAHHLTHNFS